MLHKGDKYRNVDGTVFQVFSAMDDTYTYYFIAKMQPKNAVVFLDGMVIDSFYTYYNFDKEQYLATVIDPYVFANSGVVTRGWDGITNLLFDSKGYSYEVTWEEKKIIDSYQRFKHPQPNDWLYHCKKCGNNFAANDLDYWINSGLFCPVCKADSKSIDLLDKATENG
ncbi:MAG: hypothetical protein ACI31X_01500 [Lactobacillus amylovorus]